MKNSHILAQIFISTLYISAFTFGGGYVIVTLMKRKFVDQYRWIENEEMLDLIAIAQSSPGAVAVNGAIVVGYKLAGLKGALTAILATVIPPFLIIWLIAGVYEAFRSNRVVSLLLEGMQSGVAAVIAAVVYDMAAGIFAGRDFCSISIMAGSFLASWALGLNAACIVLVCLVLGAARTLIRKREKNFDRLAVVCKFF